MNTIKPFVVFWNSTNIDKNLGYSTPKINARCLSFDTRERAEKCIRRLHERQSTNTPFQSRYVSNITANFYAPK